MRIGIDVSSAVNQTAGIGRYTTELVTSLLEIDKQNEYVFHSFFGDPSGFKKRFSEDRFQMSAHEFSGRMLRVRALCLSFLRRTPDSLLQNIDIFHVPDFAFPASRKVPSILTVHDLIFLRYPEYFTKINRTYMKQMAKFSADNARHIIADSHSTKLDIMEYFRIPEEKISVIHLAVSDLFQPVDDPVKSGQVLSTHGVDGPYLLYVGTLEPRKNVITILEAFHACLNSEQDFPYRLVVAGKKGWLYEETFQRVKKLRLEDRVVFTGYVDDQGLPVLYSNATAFVYPSIYEGFGFPVIEAMSCGAPVICANTSSLVEVAGNAALTHNPTDVEKLAQNILELTRDDALRREMIEKGFENVKRFSWAKTAEETLKIYSNIYESVAG
jgi:glycosyltransferase involved in cell wall biosynthesis